MHTGSQACCLLSAAVKASAAAHSVGHLTGAGTKSECFKIPEGLQGTAHAPGNIFLSRKPESAPLKPDPAPVTALRGTKQALQVVPLSFPG